MRRRTHATGLLVVVAALVALSGCSGGATEASSSSAGGASADRAAPAPADAQASRGAGRAPVRAKAVIKTGEISLTTHHPQRVVDDVDGLLRSVDGSVDSEDSTTTPGGSVKESSLVLRVPAGDFDSVRRAIGRMGKVQSSRASEKDVTTEVIDVDERVQTLQASLDKLQGFQRSARDVDDLLRYENEITTRSAELQSLKARQAYLAGQTSMATIRLYVALPDEYTPPPSALEDAGFLSGLEGGWHALGAVVVVGLTVLGAALPFLVAGAVVGVPVWFAVRALLRRRTLAG